MILFISLWVLEEGEKGLLSYDGLNETNDETANEKGAVDNVAAKELLLREVLMLDGEFGKPGLLYLPKFLIWCWGIDRDVILIWLIEQIFYFPTFSNSLIVI